MRDVAGIVLILIGAGFVLAGLRHRRNGPPPGPRLAATGSLVRRVAWLILAYAGIKASLAWAALDAGRFFSLLDLAGFLVLLLSYGTWLTLRTRPLAEGCATATGRGEGIRPRRPHGPSCGGIAPAAQAIGPVETPSSRAR